MKKSKGQTIDLLYTIDERKKKTKKKQKKIKIMSESTTDLSERVNLPLYYVKNKVAFFTPVVRKISKINKKDLPPPHGERRSFVSKNVFDFCLG